MFVNQEPIILLGDLNCKHPAWNCDSENRNGRILLDFCFDQSITINSAEHPTYVHPNGSTSVLDIALTRGCRLSSIQAFADMSSDHNPVVSKLRVRPILTKTDFIWDYSQANWPQFRETLNILLATPPTVRDEAELETALHYLTTTIQQTVATTVPKKKFQPRQLFIPPSLRRVLRFRNYIRRRYQKTRQLPPCTSR